MGILWETGPFELKSKTTRAYTASLSRPDLFRIVGLGSVEEIQKATEVRVGGRVGFYPSQLEPLNPFHGSPGRVTLSMNLWWSFSLRFKTFVEHFLPRKYNGYCGVASLVLSLVVRPDHVEAIDLTLPIHQILHLLRVVKAMWVHDFPLLKEDLAILKLWRVIIWNLWRTMVRSTLMSLPQFKSWPSSYWEQHGWFNAFHWPAAAIVLFTDPSILLLGLESFLRRGYGQYNWGKTARAIDLC